MRYVTIGIHTRNKKPGGIEVFMPGDEIEPTKFELVQFPNKFKQLVEKPSLGIGAEESAALKLEGLRIKLNEFIEAGEHSEDVMKEAVKLSKRNPEKQHAIDALVEDVEKFFGGLEEDKARETPAKIQLSGNSEQLPQED